MQFSFALVLVLNTLSVQSRPQIHEALDPSGANSVDLEPSSNANCTCTPFHSCYDIEIKNDLIAIVNDRNIIEFQPVIAATQASEAAACPDLLEVCCQNLDLPSPQPQPLPQSQPKPQPQLESQPQPQCPTKISPKTLTSNSTPEPQTTSPSHISPESPSTNSLPTPSPQYPSEAPTTNSLTTPEPPSSPSQINSQIPIANPSPQPQIPSSHQTSSQVPAITPSPQLNPTSPSQIPGAEPTPLPNGVTLSVVTGRPKTSNGACGVRNLGGVGFTVEGFTEDQAQYGEFPWMVALLTQNNGYDMAMGVKNQFIGGGSLIDPLVVLTTGHKPHDIEANKTLTVRVGEWNFQAVSEPIPHQDILVRQVIYHPRFNRAQRTFNYALLVLERPAVLGKTVGTICLPSNSGQRFDGQKCIISGWGKDAFGEEGKYHEKILKLVSVNMVEHLQCQSAMRTTRLGGSFQLHPSWVCAGDQGQDACTGDGGSPLVCSDPMSPGQYVQVGASAWGIGCGQQGIPGIYSAVAPVLNWIQDTLKTLSSTEVEEPISAVDDAILTVEEPALSVDEPSLVVNTTPAVDETTPAIDESAPALDNLALLVDDRTVIRGAVHRHVGCSFKEECKECYLFNSKTCQCHKIFRCSNLQEIEENYPSKVQKNEKNDTSTLQKSEKLENDSPTLQESEENDVSILQKNCDL